MPYIGIIVSFLISFLIGFKTKKYIFLILDVFLGLGIGILNIYLYLIFTPPVEAGLGIIALVPVMFILFSIFNISTALIGGTVGAFVGKKSAK